MSCHHDLTGTVTQGLLDAFVVPGNWGDSNFDDLAISNYGSFDINRYYVDKNFRVGTVLTLGLTKVINYSVWVRTTGKNCTVTGWDAAGTHRCLNCCSGASGTLKEYQSIKNISLYFPNGYVNDSSDPLSVWYRF